MKITLAIAGLAALALAFFTASGRAGEHLVPEDNQFTRAALPNGEGSLAPYYDMVITLLQDAYRPGVRARVIAMPSFEPEYAVGIIERNGAYFVFHLGLATQIWGYEMLNNLRAIDPAFFSGKIRQDLFDAIAELESRLPDDFRDVEVSRCEVPLEADLARDILDIWKTMLLRTRYDPANYLGPDGTDYHFSMPGDGDYLSGKAWEPPPGSPAGHLVGISDTMKNLCLTGDVNLISQLRPQVREMQAMLAAAE